MEDFVLQQLDSLFEKNIDRFLEVFIIKFFLKNSQKKSLIIIEVLRKKMNDFNGKCVGVYLLYFKIIIILKLTFQIFSQNNINFIVHLKKSLRLSF